MCYVVNPSANFAIHVTVGISMKETELPLKNDISQEEEAIRYRALVDSMNDGFGIINVEGVFTYVNTHFATMLDYTEEEMIGRPLMDFVDDRNRW